MLVPGRKFRTEGMQEQDALGLGARHSGHGKEQDSRTEEYPNSHAFRSRQRGRDDQQHVGSVLALSDTRRYPNLGPAGDYHLIRVNLWWRGEIGLFSSRPHQYL